MNITQSSVSLFFCLGSCQLGLRYFTENANSVFLPAVFSILEVYTYLNSVLRVFCFHFFVFVLFFCFVLFLLRDKHGCLISEISIWWNFCFKTTIWISRSLLQNHSEILSKWESLSWASAEAWRHWSILVDSGPMLDPHHTRLTSSY